MRMRQLSSACGIVLGLWCRDVSAGDLQVQAPPARWTPQALSTDQYESSPVFSPDGRELMFFRALPTFDRSRLQPRRQMALLRQRPGERGRSGYLARGARFRRTVG